MKSVFITYNTEKELAKKIYDESIEYFKRRNIQVATKVEEADFGVVIGGDGTFLRAFKNFIRKKDFYIIAINAGSLGFLTEIKKESFKDEYDNFLNGNFKSEKRAILKVKIGTQEYYALNEVVVTRAGIAARVLRVNFSASGEHMCTYKGDGVIVATPTGSTAYSLSAGGPILKSDMKAMVVTPIAPHNLNTRPIVLGGDEVVTMKIEDEDRSGKIIIDGQIDKKMTTADKVEISFSNLSLNLVIPKNRNYYSVLREKLKWGDNLC